MFVFPRLVYKSGLMDIGGSAQGEPTFSGLSVEINYQGTTTESSYGRSDDNDDLSSSR